MSDEKLFSIEPYEYPPDAYPSRHPKGTFWATNEVWDILDRLPPGTLHNAQRAYLSGLIAGALVRAKES